MGSRKAVFLFALVVGCWSALAQTNLDRCANLIWDNQQGANPLEPHLGKVVLVALMRGDCGYCTVQATLLQTMFSRISQEGVTDLKFIIVNGGTSQSRRYIGRLRNVVSDIEVIQDSRNNYMFRDAFQALKDDVLIYDRCGQRSFFLPPPYSNVHYGFLEAFLRRTLAGNHYCYCSRDSRRFRTRRDTSESESTLGNSDVESAALQNNFMECAENDASCLRLQNLLSRSLGTNTGNYNFDLMGRIFADGGDIMRSSGQVNPGFGQRRRLGQSHRLGSDQTQLSHRNSQRHQDRALK